MDRYKPDFSTTSVVLSVALMALGLAGVLPDFVFIICMVANLIIGFSMVKVKEVRKEVVKPYNEEAIVRVSSVDSCNYISVGFEDSDKVIGLFGYEGDNDEEESYANAKIFADTINGVKS